MGRVIVIRFTTMVFFSAGVSDSRVMEIAIKTLGRRERYVIVLNSGLILSPDFLYFMSQLVTIIDIDQSLIGISAWNVNGNNI